MNGLLTARAAQCRASRTALNLVLKQRLRRVSVRQRLHQCYELIGGMLTHPAVLCGAIIFYVSSPALRCILGEIPDSLYALDLSAFAQPGFPLDAQLWIGFQPPDYIMAAYL